MKDNYVHILRTIGGCFLIVLFIMPLSLTALDLSSKREAAEFTASISRIPNLQFSSTAVLKVSTHDVHSSKFRRYDAGITLPFQNNYYLSGRFGFGDFEGRSRKQLSYEASFLSNPADSSLIRYYSGLATSAQYHDSFRFRELTFYSGMFRQDEKISISSALLIDYTLGTFFREAEDDVELDSWLLSLYLSIARGPVLFSMKFNRYSVIYGLEWRFEL